MTALSNFAVLDGRYVTMRKFNPYEMYTYGGNLKQLESLPAQGDIAGSFLTIVLSWVNLQSLLTGNPLPIMVTRQTAQTLANSLNVLMQPVATDASQEQIQQAQRAKDRELSNLQSTLTQFNTILNAELSNLDTYWVEPKGIYSTNELIEHAENIFSETVRNQLAPETQQDVKEAGKCLAFDLPTAVAFHIWRAVERELRVYSQVWIGQAAGAKVWNTLLKELGGTQADAKVIAVLDHLRNLHRNPIMHPEDYLTVDEAVNLFGIANSAITAMINDKPASQSGTGSNE